MFILETEITRKIKEEMKFDFGKITRTDNEYTIEVNATFRGEEIVFALLKSMKRATLSFEYKEHIKLEKVFLSVEEECLDEDENIDFIKGVDFLKKPKYQFGKFLSKHIYGNFVKMPVYKMHCLYDNDFKTYFKCTINEL